MAVIRLGEAPPVAAARRFRLDAPTMLGLQERTGVALPDDVRVVVDRLAARVADVDLDATVAAAVERLEEHGVLDADGGPLPAVVDNLRGVTEAPRRMRTTYAGPGRELVGYHWVGAELGGSLLRDGDRFEISLFDARSLGDEVGRLLPDRPAPEPDRTAFTVPLDDLGALAEVEDEIAAEQVAPMAELLDLDVLVLESLRSWVHGFRGVLHSTVVDTDPGRPPRSLVWVDEQSGWWSMTPRTAGGVRCAYLEPRDDGDLPADLGLLLAGAWS